MRKVPFQNKFLKFNQLVHAWLTVVYCLSILKFHKLQFDRHMYAVIIKFGQLPVLESLEFGKFQNFKRPLLMIFLLIPWIYRCPGCLSSFGPDNPHNLKQNASKCYVTLNLEKFS